MFGVGACVYALGVGLSRVGKACATNALDSVKLNISPKSPFLLVSQSPTPASVNLSYLCEPR